MGGGPRSAGGSAGAGRGGARTPRRRSGTTHRRRSDRGSSWRRTISSTASSRRETRSPAAGRSKPYRRCSASCQPVPMPRTRRPPLTWSTVTASFASSDGCRKVLLVTRTPRRIRRVDAASAASSVHASRHGCSGGPSVSRRWSTSQAWSKPSSSAMTNSSRICDHGLFAWLMNRPKRGSSGIVGSLGAARHGGGPGDRSAGQVGGRNACVSSNCHDAPSPSASAAPGEATPTSAGPRRAKGPVP